MTINDNSTKSINAAIIDLQNQIKQLQHKIGILSKNQLKEDDIEFPGKVEYADEAGKAKEADHAKTADTAKYASETENAVHAGYADNATKATQDGSGNVITDTYATKTALSSGLAGKADKSHTHTKSEITDFDHTDDYGIYIPNPTFPGISYIIPRYRVQSIKEVSGVPVEGKTLQISFRLYKYVNSFSVQLSYGTTDGFIQQISGVGRTWFVEIDQNDTNYFEDDEWKVFNRSVTIPQGNPIFSVGTIGCPICINSLKVV